MGMDPTLSTINASLQEMTGASLPAPKDLQDLEQQLSDYINHLIQFDFNRLVQLLYRIDISEARLKQLLQLHPQEEAGKLIAQVMIERQLEKIKSRARYSSPADPESKEEKW